MCNCTQASRGSADADCAESFSCTVDLRRAELPVLLVLTFVFDSVALAVLFKVRSSLNKSNSINHLLVTTLAVNDWLATTIFLCTWIGTAATCSKFGGDIGCSLCGLLGTTMVIWSAFIIVTMSAVRYLSLVKPMASRLWLTSARVKVGVVLTLVYCLIHLSLPAFGLVPDFRVYTDNLICSYEFTPAVGGALHRAVIGALGAEGLLTVALVLYFNVCIILSLRKRAKVGEISVIPAMSGEAGDTRLHPTSSQRKKNAFATVVTCVSAVYVTCYAPFSSRLLYDAIRNSPDQDGLEDSISGALLFLGPLLNPILYLMCNKTYRSCLVSMVTEAFSYKLFSGTPSE